MLFNWIYLLKNIIGNKLIWSWDLSEWTLTKYSIFITFSRNNNAILCTLTDSRYYLSVFCFFLIFFVDSRLIYENLYYLSILKSLSLWSVSFEEHHWCYISLKCEECQSHKKNLLQTRLESIKFAFKKCNDCCCWWFFFISVSVVVKNFEKWNWFQFLPFPL